MNRVLSSDILFILPGKKNNKQTHTTLFFSVFRKVITIEIIDRDQYQRNETFLVRLADPSLINDDVENIGMPLNGD